MESPLIAVVGSCMIDLSCYAPRLPQPGETLHGTSFNFGFGGKGANQAVAASKLGAQVSIIARLGEDYYGKEYLKAFAENKVDTKYVQRTPGQHSGIAQITVADSGENQIVIVPGANNLLSKTDVAAAEDVLATVKVVICQLETDPNLVLQAAAMIKKGSTNGLLILNAAPARPNLSEDTITCCDILCVNETEASMIIGTEVHTVADAKKAAHELIEKGCKSVILTLGSQGAVYANSTSDVIHVGAPKVQALDTTGAGDAFIGALAYYLAYQPALPMEQTLRRACEIAAISVQKRGTQQSFPLRSELRKDLFA